MSKRVRVVKRKKSEPERGIFILNPETSRFKRLKKQVPLTPEPVAPEPVASEPVVPEASSSGQHIYFLNVFRVYTVQLSDNVCYCTFPYPFGDL